MASDRSVMGPTCIVVWVIPLSRRGCPSWSYGPDLARYGDAGNDLPALVRPWGMLAVLVQPPSLMVDGVGLWRVIGEQNDVARLRLDVESDAWRGGGGDAGDAQNEA
jgi:hypothetical protein